PDSSWLLSNPIFLLHPFLPIHIRPNLYFIKLQGFGETMKARCFCGRLFSQHFPLWLRYSVESYRRGCAQTYSALKERLPLFFCFSSLLPRILFYGSIPYRSKGASSTPSFKISDWRFIHRCSISAM